MFEGTERSQLVPQTARTVTSSGAKSGLTSSHRPHRPLELQHVWRQKALLVQYATRAKIYSGTQRSQVVPRTVRAAKCSRSQTGPKWSLRPPEMQHSGAQRSPTSSHRPLELQHVPAHREVPLIPQTAVLPHNNNLCITHEHCTLLYSVSTLPIGVAV